MCITAECADPTEVGIWWRDDSTWRLYNKEALLSMLQALLKGSYSFQLELVKSTAHPRGASYNIDLSKLVQTNKASGHKRAIKVILPSILPKGNFTPKGLDPCIEAGSPGPVLFQMRNSCMLAIHRGDITEWKVDGMSDAVVNPSGVPRGSNSLKNKGTEALQKVSLISPLKRGADVFQKGRSLRSTHRIELQTNGGVATALHRTAGPELQVALQKSVFGTGANRCRDVVVTPGFGLPASHIIHVFAPVYRQGDVASSFALLQRTYKSAVSLATLNGIRYLAFPAMSCGAGGFPVEFAARAALEAISSSDVSEMMEIHFVLLDHKALLEWVIQASKRFSKQTE